MLMHPIKHKMEGRHLISLKDEQGKRFFVTMNNLADQKGEGWVDYMWPEPGSLGGGPQDFLCQEMHHGRWYPCGYRVRHLQRRPGGNRQLEIH
jgi:signal transduction histidine kinase